ncbi:tyrosine recombinase XerC [Streptomyces longispororuber]|uniref:site-specific integrase n=1 Tax=Streptomyces longispororuber TaxID=68230 RepID=UPI0036FEB3E1
MTTEEPYDRWHKARPEPGEPECAEHPGLVPTAIHGTQMRWQARWRDRDGRQRSKNFPANRKQAAGSYQRSQRAAIDEGRDPLPHRGRGAQRIATPTIGEYVETFLSRHEGRKSTVDSYRSRLRNQVVPVLGERSVGDVKRGEYRDLFADLKRSGMADSTRGTVKTALSAMLSIAVEDGYLEGNPVSRIRLAKNKSKSQTSRLTWKCVVALAEEVLSPYELIIWFGSLQALRSMEAAGVRRSDMEDVPGKQAVEEQRQKGQAVPLKTSASRSVIPVGSFLWEKYQEHITRWRSPMSAAVLRERGRKDFPYSEEYAELVTVNRYGKPVQQSSVTFAFTTAKRRAQARGIAVPDDATFRDLRHFVDAVLIASGVEPRKVQARMRHARLSETLDTYGYLVWEVDWENAPASFEELYGMPAPPGLPAAALVPRAERRGQSRDG